VRYNFSVTGAPGTSTDIYKLMFTGPGGVLDTGRHVVQPSDKASELKNVEVEVTITVDHSQSTSGSLALIQKHSPVVHGTENRSMGELHSYDFWPDSKCLWCLVPDGDSGRYWIVAAGTQREAVRWQMLCPSTRASGAGTWAFWGDSKCRWRLEAHADRDCVSILGTDVHGADSGIMLTLEGLYYKLKLGPANTCWIVGETSNRMIYYLS
jgi:hypothetical protein